MKKITLLLILLFSTVLSAFSQNFWQQLNLPNPDMAVYSMVCDNNNRLFIASDDNIYYTNDQGANWDASTNWPGHSILNLNSNSLNYIFVGTLTEGIYRSVDGGISYQGINNGLSSQNVWCIFILDNDHILIGTTDGIFKSTDNGDNWSQFGLSSDVRAITIDENGYLYAGTYVSGVLKSIDNGLNWTPVNNGIPKSSQVTAMIAVPSFGVISAFYPEGVFLTTDEGANWTEFNDGLPFKDNEDGKGSFSVDYVMFILGMLFLIIFSIGAFYMFPSKSSALVWLALNTGLPMAPTTTSLTSNTNNDIFLGTFEDGIYMNAVPVGIEEIPGNTAIFETDNIYPNPTDGIASFDIAIPEKCKLTATVINQLGQQCMLLTDREFNEGNYRLSFNTEELRPGVYFVQVSSDKNNQTLKCIKK